MADTQTNLASLARSGRVRIAAALMVTALVGGGLGTIILRGESTGDALLFSGLELPEAGEISDRLDTAGIKYKLEGGGSAIFVPRSKVDQARMMLSEQGLPTRGSVGWEIFDKTDALGATSFVQNINKVRALEGELARTISVLDMVRTARVHVNLPERTLFQRDSIKPTATVVLGLTGHSMSGEKVRAIQNIVATTVPGLSINSITIVDDQGRMLAAGGENDGVGGLSGGAVDDRKESMESNYRSKVLEIVENIVGAGSARVQVALDMDFNRITQSEEKYNPDERVVRSSTTTESTSSSSDSEGRDGVTAANNIPGQEGAGETPVATNQSSQSNTQETVNYEISKTTRTEIIEGGKVDRISVAVAVDHMRIPGAEGEPDTFGPRPKEELDRILSLVRSAVGYNEARGDIVTVENIPFARQDLVLEEGEAPGPFAFDKFDIVHGVEILALLITALALVFFVLRPLIKGLMNKEDPAARLSLQNAANGGARLEAGGVSKARAVGLPEDLNEMSGGGGGAPIKTDPGIDVARISGQVKASSIKRVSEVVATHPEESTAIVRSWLTEGVKENVA